ncbi:DUF7144 family membrane protein [Streptomyces sp. HGB0020]|jgi:hypothetical protein|uniref:DUF7144 family membrane protein n=1 Tax=Streptomyces sp. HGB0020 TaxID=1078086 RepID=UPI00034E6B27|nr:hypothetical protein [Streptomyces sp. HGB0020]EPD62442.1 hypothetical protein HMPREF1211_04076 [Streptomyces sp. HGB0020]
MTTTTQHRRSEGVRAAASGLTMFAAVMLVMCGMLDIFRGIMAIADDEVFINTPHYVFRFDLTSWGWIHLGLGVVAMAVGIGLVMVQKWARIMGVGVAALLIIGNFLDIPYAPLWSVTLIALYGFIIWALCVVQPDSESY